MSKLPTFLTDEEVRNAHADYIAGMRWIDLTDKYQVHHTTLYKRFIRQELPIDRKQLQSHHSNRDHRFNDQPGVMAMAVYAYIVRYKEASGGDSPTSREIAVNVGRGVSSVHLHLKTLERYGLIERGGHFEKRRIRVVGMECKMREAA